MNSVIVAMLQLFQVRERFAKNYIPMSVTCIRFTEIFMDIKSQEFYVSNIITLINENLIILFYTRPYPCVSIAYPILPNIVTFTHILLYTYIYNSMLYLYTCYRNLLRHQEHCKLQCQQCFFVEYIQKACKSYNIIVLDQFQKVKSQ